MPEETEGTPEADAAASDAATEDASSSEGGGPKQRRCDYCRLPISSEPVTAECNGGVHEYCCNACREAVEEHERVFTQYHGFRRVPTGVAPMDESLPQGVPRNSFVLLTDLAGTRTEAIQAELVWRALERGEPAVFISFLEPPMSVVQEFVTLDWNVLPYLESGQLQILDCFTYRLENRERMYDRLNDWNSFLSATAAEATTQVRDPTELGELHNRIDDVLEARDMEDRGIVVIDSLTEFGALVQPVQAYDFLKDVRAEVCKSRFVPIFAGATVTSEDSEFPHDLSYMMDGIVEMNLNDDLVEGSLMKQIRTRKMSGVLNLPKWVLYEYTAGEGIVTIDIRDGPPDSKDGDESDESDESADAAGDSESGSATGAAAPADEGEANDAAGTEPDPGDVPPDPADPSRADEGDSGSDGGSSSDDGDSESDDDN